MRIKLWFCKSAHQKNQTTVQSKLPMRVTKTAPSGTEEIVVPEDVSWMRIVFQNGVLRGIRIEKINASK
jgi:hypothetical protein